MTSKWLFAIQRSLFVERESPKNKNRRATVTNVRYLDERKKTNSFAMSFYSMDKGSIKFFFLKINFFNFSTILEFFFSFLLFFIFYYFSFIFFIFNFLFFIFIFYFF